jgi:uncharacterized protein YggL (DUF469 family)
MIVRNSHFKKKRLRKKYHQGEFKQLGFEINADWVKEYKLIFDNEQEAKDYNNDIFLLIEKVEDLKLVSGGSFGPKGASLFVCKHKGTCTQEDANKLKALWEATGIVKNIQISDLVDVWYGEL